MEEDYKVLTGAVFHKFYEKAFQKKYHGRWSVTLDSLKQMCKRIETVYGLELCDEIKKVDNRRLLKIDFAVAKSGESPKTSGCRLIAVSDDDDKTIEMLIVYCKSDIEHINSNETLAWKALVSTEYPEHRSLVTQ